MARTRLRRFARAMLAASVLIVSLAALGVAQAALPPIAPPPIVPPFVPPWMYPASTVSQPATITGSVQSVTGGPIAGVTVDVHGETSSTMNPYFTQTAVTKPDGTFVITDVIQGTYEMTINEQTGAHPVLAYAESYPWSTWSGPTDTSHWIQGGHTTSAGTFVLPANTTVSGRVMSGGTPVSGAEVDANISDDGFSYMRWATTGSDGRFAIPNARPGDWTLTYKASGQYVPVDAVPAGWSQDGDPVAQSAGDSFSVSAGTPVSLPDKAFQPGQRIIGSIYETLSGNSYQVSNIQISATLVSDPSVVYYFATGDDGWVRNVYMPPGTYTFVMHDAASDAGSMLPAVYNDLSLGDKTLVSGGATWNISHGLTPSADSYAVSGRLNDASTGANVESWLTASIIDPSVPWTRYYRRVVTNGTGGSTSATHYLIRLPKAISFDGVSTVAPSVLLQWADWTSGSPPVVTHVSQAATITPSAPIADQTHNVLMPVGGVISGVVHDEAGNPVPGVLVSALRLAYDPYFNGITWTAPDTAWTRTTFDGSYSIGGLPTDADYKVNFSAYYDPGMPLPIKYQDYYRRTWQGLPLADSLNTSATPVTPDHTPVSVEVGETHAGVDETITPGGYVGLHANGLTEPTGAVWCDVMYRIGSSWIEVDSGYTTGGTFEKLWKVLPPGSYNLNYADFFGRGSGTWTFTLAPGETKYGSVLVPAPLTVMSGSAKVGGSFAGVIDGGLPTGGVGSAQLSVQQLASLPSTAPALPVNTIAVAGGAFDFTAPGNTLGTWTLTLPYDAGIADGDVHNLLVRHLLADGTVEMLSPIAWNTRDHTLQVQTKSLSPFQVVFTKAKVSLGTPATSGTLKANHSFTAFGTLSPWHTAGAKSVVVKVYRQNSSRRWVLYKTFIAKNYNYRAITQYKAAVKIARGTYRFYAYAAADTWHLATTSGYRTVKVR